MADQTELLAEVQRELTAIRIEAERLAGRVRRWRRLSSGTGSVTAANSPFVRSVGENPNLLLSLSNMVQALETR